MHNISTSSSTNEAKKHMIENNAQVVLRNICFSYDDGKTWTLEQLNLTIHPGERVAIVGKNGSGKSTLAKIIAGLVAPDSGYVELCGEKVFENTTAYADAYKNARKYIGALFQSPEDQIITTITEEDVAFGLENLQFPQETMHKHINEALKTVHMEDKRYDDPSTMSGGQQQRVALASAIAMNSKLLVLDEPTSMLDSFARKDVDALFDNLHKNGTTIVQITHNFEECKRANRILLLKNGILKEVSLNGLKTYFSHIELANNHVTNMSESKNLTDSRCKENKSDIAVEISGLTVQYDKTSPAVINNYSLAVKSGETVAIMGENGCGKSTLAKTMCGLLKVNSGNITVHGISVRAKTSRIIRQKLHQTIGYVMQLPEQQLFADTVRNDVAYGPKNFGLKGNALKERVDETLRLLNLENLAEKSPFALSGGQQRLVAIAGVLACKPRVLVLDEPTAGLDFEAALRIREILEMLHNQGVTIILITHNLQEAEDLGARLVTLKARNKANNTENSIKKESFTKRKITSLLQSFDPRATLLSCFILMLSAFSITNYIQLAILAFTTFTLTVAAKIPFVKLIASLHMIIAVFVFSGLLNILTVRTGTVLANIATIPITTDGMNYAILFATRFSLVIIIGAILVLTMSQTTLSESCTRLLSPLRHIGIPTQEIALIMSLALRFLPTLSAEAHSVALAQIARGSSIRDGSFKQRVHAITALIVPGFAGVIRHADTLALALDARCYTPEAERTHLYSWKIRIKDVLLLVITLSVVCAIIVCNMLPW